MSQNQFIVDLGDLKISDEQRTNINAAIQKAVTGELVNFSSTNKVAFFPVSGHTGKIPFPILWGIIIRPRKDEWLTA